MEWGRMEWEGEALSDPIAGLRLSLNPAWAEPRPPRMAWAERCPPGTAWAEPRPPRMGLDGAAPSQSLLGLLLFNRR